MIFFTRFAPPHPRRFVPAALIALVLISYCFPASAGDKFLDIREIKSKGGVTAWLVEDHSLPIISMDFAFRGAGAAGDAPGKQGLAQLASNTMDEGAGDLDSQTFQKKLADNSISLSFSASRDDFSGSLKTLSRRKDLAFGLLQMALTHPRFDAEAIARMKAANIARLRSSLTDPDWMAARIMNDIAFAGHPYAQNSGGTLTTIPAITAEDLRDFSSTRLARGNLVVAVTGDIGEKELAEALDEIFGKMPERATLPAVADISVQGGGQTVLFEKDIPQTIISVMQPGIGRGDPDYHAWQVMNFIYGGSGFGSRLMEEAREKRGLTYGIYSGFYLLDHLKGLTVSTSTENKNAGDILNIVRSEMKKMTGKPVTDKELADAKSYLTGSMPLALTSTEKISGLVLGLQLDGLPIGYLDSVDEKINAVTIGDVRRVAEKYLTPDSLTTVVVGKPAGVTPSKTVGNLPNVE